eukprot:422808-Amphidinium_carterae.1
MNRGGMVLCIDSPRPRSAPQQERAYAKTWLEHKHTKGVRLLVRSHQPPWCSSPAAVAGELEQGKENCSW